MTNFYWRVEFSKLAFGSSSLRPTGLREAGREVDRSEYNEHVQYFLAKRSAHQSGKICIKKCGQGTPMGSFQAGNRGRNGGQRRRLVRRIAAKSQEYALMNPETPIFFRSFDRQLRIIKMIKL